MPNVMPLIASSKKSDGFNVSLSSNKFAAKRGFYAPSLRRLTYTKPVLRTCLLSYRNKLSIFDNELRNATLDLDVALLGKAELTDDTFVFNLLQ